MATSSVENTNSICAMYRINFYVLGLELQLRAVPAERNKNSSDPPRVSKSVELFACNGIRVCQ